MTTSSVDHPAINPPARRRPAIGLPETPVSSDMPLTERVGYKCPPKHTQFKKGVSGNPHGRPKGALGMKALVRKLLTEKVGVRTPDGIKRMTKMEAALHKIAERAFGGDLRALQHLVQLYQASVPDEVVLAKATIVSARDDDPHDLAILEALREELRAQPESGL